MPDPVTLTETEKAYVAEIIGCDSPELFAAELLAITAEQETILKADVVLWQTVRNDFDYITGEINSNPASTRKAIKERVVAALDVGYLVDVSKRGGRSGRILRA